MPLLLAISFILCSPCLGLAQAEHHEHHDEAGQVDHSTHQTVSIMSTVTGGPFRSMFALGWGTALQPASTPMAALSRGVVGSRGSTLIANLPGSPKGATESLTALLPVLRHALDQLGGGDH